MPKCRHKTVFASDEATAGCLAKVLARLKKTELIDVIVKLAGVDRSVMRWLEAELDVATPPQELVAPRTKRSPTRPPSTSARSITTLTTITRPTAPLSATSGN